MNIYKPTQFKQFIINKHITTKLSLFNINNLQNIILFGKKNSGKKTLLYAFINHLFNIGDNNSINIRTVTETNKYKTTSYTYTYKQCDYFYEIDFLKNIKNIKKIINHFIKQLCSNKTLHDKYRIIIIRNIDVINKQNIKSLSYIIEKYYRYNKFIILSEGKNMNIYYSKIKNLCFTIKCYICTNEIEEYLRYTKKKYTTNIKNKIIQCNDLYTVQQLIHYKTLPQYEPIHVFLKKIHTLLLKSSDILFISKLKTLIYDIYLLNYNLDKIPIQYVKYILKQKTDLSNNDRHTLYHIAHTYNPINYFELFSFVENFFIEIKIRNLV